MGSGRPINETSGINELKRVDELSWYVVEHYLELLTSDELAALRAFRVSIKMEAVDSPQHKRLLKRWAPETEGSKKLMLDGIQSFYERVRERLLEEHPDKVVVNRCPECRALARTPKAWQCPRCIHRW